ncbi:SRPBCC family protein [Plantactinospora sp. BB1]|uniref:SRPBCC family protein n=1 Tax=Plantactinospora sp. BB1 TaxID=2071627 RepID=UPI00131F16B4|nr:SRPBCC family protein [Plantactinospora sp. BB1]
MAMDVNRNAPVVIELEVFTRAAPGTVWNLHTDIDRWSDWNPHIERANLRGSLRVGATFDWRIAGLEITSTVADLVPQRRIAWGGRTRGIDGLHVWTFSPQPEGVLVRTEESWDGEPVRVDPTNLRIALEASLRDWLSALKKTAEADGLPEGGSA